MGGGGDVVGALALGGLLQAEGIEVVLGGLTWERIPVDPLPGPRRLDEVEDAERLSTTAALAGPKTRGPGGFLFAESRMAALTGRPVVLIDPHDGPQGVADGLAAAARRTGCVHVVLLDVGGDVLAHGDEAGLGSPLADSICLAAHAHLGLPCTLAVIGAGCDGELTPGEVAARIAEVRAAGGVLGTWTLARGHDALLERLGDAIREIPTEASAMTLRAAQGERGPVPIRDGRRTVQLTAAGGEVVLMDPAVAQRTAARCAEHVKAVATLQEANAILRGLGIPTELEFETAHGASDER